MSEPCRFHAQSRCRYGTACKFSHDIQASLRSESLGGRTEVCDCRVAYQCALNAVMVLSRAVLQTANPTAGVVVNPEASKPLTRPKQLSHKYSGSPQGLPRKTPATLRLLGHPEVPRVARLVTLGKSGRAQEVPNAKFNMYVILSKTFRLCVQIGDY